MGLTYTGVVDTDEASLFFRFTEAATGSSGYELAASVDAVTLYRWDGGVRTPIGSAPWTPGFGILQVTDPASANPFVVQWNGVDLFTATDTTYTTGKTKWALRGFTASGGFGIDTAHGEMIQ